MQTASEADVARGCARPPDICCRRRKQSNGFPISGGGENHLAGELPTHRWGVEPTRSSDYEPRLRPGLGNPDSSGTQPNMHKNTAPASAIAFWASETDQHPNLGGSERILPRSGHFEGLSRAPRRMVITHSQFAVVIYGDTRKGMTHNDLHYLAAAIMFGGQVTECVGTPSSCASFQDP